MHEINVIPKFKDAQNNIDSMNSVSRIIGILTVSFVLGLSVFYPVFSKYDVQVMPVKQQELAAVGQGENNTTGFNPYYYQPPSGYGTFGKWLLNSTVIKQWLKNNFYWRLEASGDSATWVDANSLLTVGMNWNETNQSYKVTLTLNTNTAPKALYYRFILACNSTMKDYINDTGNATWMMTIPTDSGRDVTIFFNWSDIKPLIANGKVTYKHGTINKGGNEYLFFMITTVNKVNPNAVFVIDPVYGTIGDAITDSWEWDEEEGYVATPNALCRLGTSQYYMTSAAGDGGSDYDGFLRTFQVFNNNGSIGKTLISKWEYDITDGYYAGITPISGNIYAIIYCDNGATASRIFTTTAWSSNGTLKQDMIDTENLGYYASQFPSLVHVSGDIYAAVYQEKNGGYDHQIETFEITSAGAISARKDIVEFDASSTGISYGTPYAVMVDSDTIAIAWASYISSDSDSYIATYNISGVTGDITNTPADIWKCVDTSSTMNTWVFLHKISANIFAMSYNDVDSDGWTKTVQINDDGNIIGNAWIDTLEWANTNTVTRISMFTVNDASLMGDGNGVYGITFQDSTGDGWVYTINITNAGVMPATRNDRLEFDTSNTIEYSPVVYVSGNYYLCVYQGTNSDGWSCTFTIETAPVTQPWSNTCPTATGEHPTNSTTGISLIPAVGGTVNDADTNHTLNVTFASNYSGSWTNYQTNNSVARGGKVNWTFNGATINNHKYYWRMYVHDGFCNQSFSYSFTTVSGWSNSLPYVPSGAEQPYNGSIGSYAGVPIHPNFYHLATVRDNDVNQTMNVTYASNASGSWVNYHTFSSIANNSITNYTFLDNLLGEEGHKYWWRVYLHDGIANRSFTFFYTTRISTWHIIDNTVTGGAYNKTQTWKIIDNTITGAAFNRTATWHIVDNAVTGSAFNRTATWHVVDSSITGSAHNTTGWHVIDSSITGSAHNTTGWHIIDNTITGGAYNRTLTWHIIDSGITGGAWNKSASWYIIDNTITGSAYNKSASWHVIDSAVTGSAYNLTGWHIIDNTITGSAFNRTLTWHIIDSGITGNAFNKTASWHDIDTSVTGSAYNLTLWHIIDNTITGGAWNYSEGEGWHDIDTSVTGSAYNLTGWHIIDSTVTGSAYNKSASWYIIDNTITGSAFNKSASWYIIDNTITGSAFNRTATWYIIDNTITGGAYNASIWFIVDNTVTGSAFNRTQTWHIIDSSITGGAWNISTWFVVDNTVTGSAYNRTATWHIIDSSITGMAHGEQPTWHIVDNTITGGAHNTTGWHTIDTITGSAHNTTLWHIIDNTITGSAFNVSNIVISNVYPVNNSNVTGLQPVIYFNINSTYGTFNYIVYIGNSSENLSTILCTQNNVTNGTFYYPYILATLFNSDYYFRIVVDSSNRTESVLVHFTTSPNNNGVIAVSPTSFAFGLLGIIGIVGVIGFIYYRKRKKG